jgi:hypothetical protein
VNHKSSKNTSPSASTNTLEFNTGAKAKREVRKLFAKSEDPLQSIQEFQKSHSLHSMMAKALGTASLYDKDRIEAGSCSNAKKTRAGTKKSISQQAEEEKVSGKTKYESFHPEPVLTFLHHLNVPLRDVHRRIMEQLRANLLEEIAKRTLPSGREALMHLLRQSWGVAAASTSITSTTAAAPPAELVLRPVLVAVLKKLEEEVPPSVLITMAERDHKTKELKYGELLKEIPLKMRRLVWEADVDDHAAKSSSSSSGDAKGGASNTDTTGTLLEFMVNPLIDEYATGNDALVKAANLAFPTGISERRANTTQLRRQPSKTTVAGVATSETTGGGTTTSSFHHSSANNNKSSTFSLRKMTSAKSGASNSAQANHQEAGQHQHNHPDADKPAVPQSTPGDSLVKIREIVGNRPKLLSAVMNLLVARHGKSFVDKKKGGTERSLLGGARYLHCSLLSDILITYGHLPKAYEHIGILSRIVDESVKLGVLKDDHLSQMQACLRFIFHVEPPNNNATEETTSALGTTSGCADNSPATSNYVPKDVEFIKSIMVKLITNAITSLKINDPQSLFMNPVTDEIAPGYSQVIHEPMCIITMEEKVSKKQYTDLSQVERDVKLMFQNCIAYNIGKDGAWFRTEAKRQFRLFKEPILKKAKEMYKREMTQRRKVLEKRAASEQETTRKQRKTPLETVMGITRGADGSSGGKQKGPVINQLTAKDLNPLPFFKSKKRKKQDVPNHMDAVSMPAMASMLLADPFLVRLLLHRLLRAIREELPPPKKKLPCGLLVIPSILQMLNMAQLSSQICAIHGKKYIVPDPGFFPKDEDIGEVAVAFASLRRFTPLLAKLLVDVKLDRRVSIGGDLFHAAAQVNGLRSAKDDVGKKNSAAEEWTGASSMSAVRAGVQGCWVHLLQPGNSSDAALKVQYPKFVAIMEELTNDTPLDLLNDKPFFASKVSALSKFKGRLSHSTRDLVVQNWLKWLGPRSDGKRKRSMSSPLHETLISLLNEVSSYSGLLISVQRWLQLTSSDLFFAFSLFESGQH